MSSPNSMPSNKSVVTFIVVLCAVCALILAGLSSALGPKQDEAKSLEQAKQLLIACKLLSPEGHFLIEKEGQFVPAIYDAKSQLLVASLEKTPATSEEISLATDRFVVPLLTDSQGRVTTFKQAHVDYVKYLADNKKTGYAKLPQKLFYQILANTPPSDPQVFGYIFPCNGFGLWGPIYGYLAVAKDGLLVIGASWNTPAETPGLGAVYSDPNYLSQFYGKSIFQKPTTGTLNLQIAPLGIIVVKGKVSDVFGTAPKSYSAVDGVSGATLTGDGVTQAYQNCLDPYRPLLIKINEGALGPQNKP